MEKVSIRIDEQITFSGHGYSGQCNKMDIYVEEKDYETF